MRIISLKRGASECRAESYCLCVPEVVDSLVDYMITCFTLLLSHDAAAKEQILPCCVVLIEHHTGTIGVIYRGTTGSGTPLSG